MKRVLPSLSSLEVFEACARYANFTRAAEELGITQSSVSRHIAHLEEFLGIQLFERIRRKVLLTSAGKEYSDSIKDILRQAERATVNITTSQTGKVLHVSSYATFAAKWLAPKLVSFFNDYPDIPLQLTALDHHRAFATPDSGVDVAIHYGESSWPDSLMDLLMHEYLLLVCTPQYARDNKIVTPSDLARVTRLHQIKADSWPDMFAALNVSGVPRLRGPRFDQYGPVIEATLSGLGVAVIPSFIIESHLKAGELVALFDVSISSRYAYYIVYPEAKRSWKSIKSFRRWIVMQAKRTEQEHLQKYPTTARSAVR